MVSDKDVNEGTNDVEEIQPDKDGKYPETVSWKQYVGTKESLGGKLDAEREKVKSLEEQLTGAIKQEDFDKIKSELEEAKTTLESKTKELDEIKERTTSEKKSFLKKQGVSEEEIDKMSVDGLNAAVMVLESRKPKLDLGSGGGGVNLPSNPVEAARQAYQ